MEENFISPLHLLKLDWYEISKSDNLLSSSSEQFLSNLNIFRQSLGSAVETFTRILRMTLLSETKRHLRKFPMQCPFLKDDICLFIKVSGYQLVRVLSTHPQYCRVFASDRKIKNIHASLLCLVYRPHIGCSSFIDKLRDKPDDDGNVIIATDEENQCTDEENQQKCLFSYFFPSRLGHHHAMSAGPESLSVSPGPVPSCPTDHWPGPPASPRHSRDESWAERSRGSLTDTRQIDISKHASSDNQQTSITKGKLLWSPFIFPVRSSFCTFENVL